MEECWFIYGKKIGPCWIGYMKYHSRGTFASVDFNWSEASKSRILGFYHSHPGGSATPSIRDDRTMSAWVKAEGRPLLCGIFSDGLQQCYIYKKGSVGDISCIRINSKIVDNFFFAWE